jgi:ElaB/YqjD/DUF883 family membrane-anchored ribosome-binding protein
MGERPDEMNGDPQRQHDMRGRGADDVVGRAPEGMSRETRDDAARLRTEIARTREDMSETIDEIQDRLNPRNLMSQARETVKEKTVGRVKEAARNVGLGAQSAAAQTREAAAGATETVKQNRWPAILIGSGVAWLLIDNARRRRSSDYDYVEYEGIERIEGIDMANEYGEGGMPPASGYASRSYEPRIRRNPLRQGASQFQRLLHRNPLAVGAIAATVGVGVGLALPETERENRLMGEARDNLVERAQGAAQGAVEKAKEVAGDAAKEVAGEAAKQVIEPRSR